MPSMFFFVIRKQGSSDNNHAYLMPSHFQISKLHNSFHHVFKNNEPIVKSYFLYISIYSVII